LQISQTTEHELYNQLTTASGNVQLLQRESDLTAQHQMWAERAHGGIDRALTTIRGMRDLPELHETVWSKGTLKTIDLRPARYSATPPLPVMEEPREARSGPPRPAD
jgi:hypothetical protein